MRSKSLLIVEDDWYVLDVLSRFFASCRYTVHTAGTCADALRLSAAHAPDCLLLDFHLKDGKGDRVCRAIRADGRLKHTPIVMLSVDPTKELDSYREYQADAFILKGAPLEKVKAVVESVLRRVGWDRGILVSGDLRLEAADLSVYRDARLLVRLSQEQFHLLFLLLERSGSFVGEDLIAGHVLKNRRGLDNSDAVRALACRLRRKLGPQIAGRIKNRRENGWIYIQPRDRKADKLARKLSSR